MSSPLPYGVDEIYLNPPHLLVAVIKATLNQQVVDLDNAETNTIQSSDFTEERLWPSLTVGAMPI